MAIIHNVFADVSHHFTHLVSCIAETAECTNILGMSLLRWSIPNYVNLPKWEEKLCFLQHQQEIMPVWSDLGVQHLCAMTMTIFLHSNIETSETLCSRMKLFFWIQPIDRTSQYFPLCNRPLTYWLTNSQNKHISMHTIPFHQLKACFFVCIRLADFTMFNECNSMLLCLSEILSTRFWSQQNSTIETSKEQAV